jgi:predicted DNA-binding transcriptional regulator YafY
MNRTDRLYAIVEELRARSPRAVSASKLAERFEVAVRTVERDLLALQEAGVPIYAETGRRGGYVLDATRALPPINFNAAEAAAIAVALSSARAALTKIMAAMSDSDAEAARELGARVLVFSDANERRATVPRAVEQAIIERRVVRLRYADKAGRHTDRVVEPLAVVAVGVNWYLSAWCRLRDDVRFFRLDRIGDAFLTREIAPERELPTLELPDLHGRRAIE